VQTDGSGSAIPAGTPICPGYTFAQTGKTSGVEWFQYTCETGDVIDYGAPYK
jgi:hypothetical protein